MRYYVWFGQRDCSHKRTLIFVSNSLSEIADRIIDETDSFWCYTHNSLESFIEEQDEKRIFTNIDDYLSLQQKAAENTIDIEDIKAFSFMVSDCEAYINEIFFDYQHLKSALSLSFPSCELPDLDETDETAIDNTIESFNDVYGV